MKSIQFGIRSVCCCAVTLFLAGCGGGGGGGESSGPGGDARTGVRMLHGAIDGSPVDLLSSANGLVQVSRFAEPSLHGSLSTGAQILTVTRTKNAANVLGAFDVTVEKNQRSTVLLYGDRAQSGLATNTFSDDPGEIPDGKSAVRGIHSIGGAREISISVNGVAQGATAAFGSPSAYIFAPAGELTVVVRRSSDNQLIASRVILAEEGRGYSLFVTGTMGYLSLVRVLED